MPALTSRESWTGAIRSFQGAQSVPGRFARGAVWALAGAAVAQGAALCASIVTARLLGLEGFGQFGILQSTAGTLSVFAGLGLGVTVTKYVAEFRASDPERAGRIIALGWGAAVVSGGTLAAALIALAPLLSAKALNAPELAPGLRIAAALLLLNAVGGTQIGALAGFEQFRSIARINLVRGILALPVTLVAVFFWRLPGAVAALAITSAAGCVLNQNCLRRTCASQGIRLRWSGGWAERRILWTFSTPALLSASLASPVLWAATALLVNQPGGYAEMGVFNAASQWRSVIVFVPGVLAQSTLPLLSNLNGEKDRGRYLETLRWNLLLTGAASVAAAAPVLAGAGWIMRWYGAGFERGALVLSLSAVTAVIMCLNGVAGTAILSGGSVWAGLAFNALWAITFLCCCRFFVPSHLAVGLAGSLLAAYIAHTGWQSVYLYRRFRELGRG